MSMLKIGMTWARRWPRFIASAYSRTWRSRRQYRGHDGAAAYYRLWWNAFQLQFRRDAHSHIHWTTDNRCIAEGVFSGVHVGPFLGVEPTGASVTYRFIVVVDFRDGLMAGERFYYDLEGIRRQIMAESRTRRA